MSLWDLVESSIDAAMGVTVVPTGEPTGTQVQEQQPVQSAASSAVDLGSYIGFDSVSLPIPAPSAPPSIESPPPVLVSPTGLKLTKVGASSASKSVAKPATQVVAPTDPSLDDIFDDLNATHTMKAPAFKPKAVTPASSRLGLKPASNKRVAASPATASTPLPVADVAPASVDHAPLSRVALPVMNQDVVELHQSVASIPATVSESSPDDLTRPITAPSNETPSSSVEPKMPVVEPDLAVRHEMSPSTFAPAKQQAGVDLSAQQRTESPDLNGTDATPLAASEDSTFFHSVLSVFGSSDAPTAISAEQSPPLPVEDEEDSLAAWGTSFSSVLAATAATLAATQDAAANAFDEAPTSIANAPPPPLTTRTPSPPPTPMNLVTCPSPPQPLSFGSGSAPEQPQLQLAEYQRLLETRELQL